MVLLQTRESAQNAKDELNGIMLRDNELKIGWGKAVTIPPAALAGGAAPALPLGLAALAAAKGASVPPPGMAAPLPWANQPQESEKKPHDGNGEYWHDPGHSSCSEHRHGVNLRQGCKLSSWNLQPGSPPADAGSVRSIQDLKRS